MKKESVGILFLLGLFFVSGVYATEVNLALDSAEWDVIPTYTIASNGGTPSGSINNINDGIVNNFFYVYQGHVGNYLDFLTELNFSHAVSYISQVNFEFEKYLGNEGDILASAQVFNGSWNSINCLKTKSVSTDSLHYFETINCSGNWRNVERIKVRFYSTKRVTGGEYVTGEFSLKLKELRAIGVESIVPVCVPDCSGLECGQDRNGCGESCGTCQEGYDCNSGECSPIRISCINSEDIVMKLFSPYNSAGALWNFDGSSSSSCPSGMVGYYKLDSDANDFSGNNNHGINLNATNFVPAKVNNGRDFNGIDQWVNISDKNYLDLTNFTIESWVRIDDFPSSGGYNDYQQKVILAKGGSSPSDLSKNYEMSIIDVNGFYSIGDNPKILCRFNSVGHLYHLVYNIDDSYIGRFVHVACTFSGNNFKMYINGTEVLATLYNVPLVPASYPIYPGVISDSPEINNAPLYFGAHFSRDISHMAGGILHFFDGIIDEVAIYNISLSQAEISAHYNSGAGRAYCDISSSAYNYEVCYSNIFGELFSGSMPHDCTGSNKIIGISAESGALGEIPSNSIYPINVCYGNLSCENDSSSGDLCLNEGNVVLRLSSNTASNISDLSSSNPVKICCKAQEGSSLPGNIFWANGDGEEIFHADLGDTVKMIYRSSGLSEGENVLFEIFERDIGDLNDIKNIMGRVDSSGNLEVVWTILESDLSKTSDLENFVFRVNGLVSDELNISDDSEDSKMVLQIISPDCGNYFNASELVNLKVEARDEDDIINGELKVFSEGVELFNYSLTNGGLDVNRNFDVAGNYQIVLNGINGRGKMARMISNVMVINRTKNDVYVAACIDSPDDFTYITSSRVEFDARSTTGINFTVPSTYEVISKSQMNFYWTFYDGTQVRVGNITDGIDSNSYYFNKTFSSSGNNSAVLRVELK